MEQVTPLKSTALQKRDRQANNVFNTIGSLRMLVKVQTSPEGPVQGLAFQVAPRRYHSAMKPPGLLGGPSAAEYTLCRGRG